MKHKRVKIRNHTAMGMIIARTGSRQIFADRRTKRAKDYKHSWQKETQEESR